jgi:hypothetical protein
VAALGRGISVLLVETSEVIASLTRAEVSQDSPLDKSLGPIADHLISRSDVDASRIAAYGDGVASIYATRIAVEDCRIAAAVCDGGLWV